MKEDHLYALFSGGHDSLASTILASRMKGFNGVVHLNTGIGIEQTRQFVRDTCAARGWPLTELHSAHQYETLVLERGGFPAGPRAHSSFYFYLKQQPLRKWAKTIPGVFGLATGIRKAESTRRMNAALATPERKEGRKIWLAPILDWTAGDVSDLIDAEGFNRNPVVDLLHRSGECLCGALARSDEIHDIDLWYPEVGARIHRLEAECEKQRLVAATWASKEAHRIHADQGALFSKAALCHSCEANQ